MKRALSLKERMGKARFFALLFLAVTILLVATYLLKGYRWADILSQISFLLFGVYTGAAGAFSGIIGQLNRSENGRISE